MLHTMPATLSSRVFVYPSRGKFPTRSALLELNPDNTVRLTEVDPDSSARREILFDESITDLQVGGAATSLTFTTHAGETWRVDFSPYNAGQRVITAQQANSVILNRADIGVWVAKLRDLGYPSRYRTIRAVRLIAGVVIVAVVLIIIVIIAANLFRPIFT
jgi:hypothetical protein